MRPLVRFPENYQGILLHLLRGFVEQKVVNAVVLVGEGKGFSVQVRLISGVVWLHSEKSGKRRVFAKVETALRLLKSLGIPKVEVDLTSWDLEKDPILGKSLEE